MDTQSDLPVWDLWLSEKPPHTLIRSGFRLKPGSASRLATRPKDFRWTPGVHALTIANVQYKTRCMEGEQGDIAMAGELGSPAASLAMALAQAEQQAINWPAKISGEREAGVAILCNYFEHHQSGKPAIGDETFVVAVRRSMLPPGNIHVWFVKGESQWELTDLEELEDLGRALCDRWKGKQNRPPPRPTEAQFIAAPAARPPTRSFAASNTPQTKKKTPVPRPDNYLSGALIEYLRGLTRMLVPARGNRSLAEFFTQLSLDQIVQYIVLLLFYLKGGPWGGIDDLLEPKCIHVIAEKLVDIHLGSYYVVYRHVQLHDSDKIKQAVSDLIQRNSDLRDRMIKNVLTYCDSCIEALSHWWRASAEFYSVAFVKRFEIPVLLALDEPKTRGRLEHYFEYALPSLTDCLEAFAKAEAYDGVRAILGICLQNDLFFLRSALEENGADSVLRFWHQSKRLMTDGQRKQVRTFLVERTVDDISD